MHIHGSMADEHADVPSPPDGSGSALRSTSTVSEPTLQHFPQPNHSHTPTEPPGPSSPAARRRPPIAALEAAALGARTPPFAALGTTPNSHERTHSSDLARRAHTHGRPPMTARRGFDAFGGTPRRALTHTRYARPRQCATNRRTARIVSAPQNCIRARFTGLQPLRQPGLIDTGMTSRWTVGARACKRQSPDAPPPPPSVW